MKIFLKILTNTVFGRWLDNRVLLYISVDKCNDEIADKWTLGGGAWLEEVGRQGHILEGCVLVSGSFFCLLAAKS